MRPLILACALLGAQDRVSPHLEAVPWSSVPDVALEDGATLREALGRSLAWMKGPAGVRTYASWGEPLRQRMIRSLEALEGLAATPPEDLRAALERTFTPYRLQDSDGVLHLTGYCEAWAEGSRRPSARYRFPLYGVPKDFSRWPRPHPTRLALEGRDGTGSPRLRKHALVWLEDRMAAYLFHVQGSGRVKLAEGGELALGFAGRTDHPFVAVGDLVNRTFAEAGRPAPSSGPYAALRADPGLAAAILPRNPRFVFFAPVPEGPPKGAYAMGLTAGRSYAADSQYVPPGAATLLSGSFGTRLAFNQDRGGAIQGPGRLDVYAGGGPDSVTRSGAINGPGAAYILLMKE